MAISRFLVPTLRRFNSSLIAFSSMKVRDRYLRNSKKGFFLKPASSLFCLKSKHISKAILYGLHTAQEGDRPPNCSSVWYLREDSKPWSYTQFVFLFLCGSEERPESKASPLFSKNSGTSRLEPHFTKSGFVTIQMWSKQHTTIDCTKKQKTKSQVRRQWRWGKGVGWPGFLICIQVHFY